MIEKAATSFEKGLVIVDDSLNQPAGSYPFALNAIKDSVANTPHTIANEKGFKRYTNLIDTGDIILRAQPLNDNSFVLFIYNETSTPTSKICLVEESTTSELSGVITTLYENEDLNFNPLYPIKSTYKTNYKGERLVYYIDNFNNNRVINIDDISNYTANLGSLSPKFSVPLIDFAVNDNGGSITTGSYQFFMAYRSSEVTTAYTALTSAVNILKAPQSETSKGNNEKGGIESGVPTTKSISVYLGGLDTNYLQMDIGVLITQNGVTTPYIIKKAFPYTGTAASFVYTGNEDKILLEDLNEVLVDPVLIEKSGVITQKDNRLLLGDITYQNNVLDYQAYANNIRVNWYDTESVEGATETLSLRAGNSVTDKYDVSDREVTKQFKTLFIADVPLSFMRDEVYALGIQFELKNGGYTPVYHIPGRALDLKASGVAFTDLDTNPEVTDNFSTWDSKINTVAEYESVERWKVVNTASLEGELAYYESEEVYPSGYGFPTTGSSVNGEGATKVRHHKMPDGRLSPIYSTEESHDGVNYVYTNNRKYLGLNFSNIEIPPAILEQINSFRIMIAPRDTDTNKSILAKGLFQNIFLSNADTVVLGHTPKKYNNYDTTDDDADLTGDNTGSPSRENRLKAFYSPDTLIESPTLSVDKASVECMMSGVPYYIYYNPSDSEVMEQASVCLINQISTVDRAYGNIQSQLDEAIYIGYSSYLSDLGNISLISRFYNTARQPLVLLQSAIDLNNSEDQADANTVDNENPDNKTSFMYGSIRRNNTSQYGNILNLQYTPTNLIITDLSVNGDDVITTDVAGTIGDTYIELFTKKISHTKYKDYLANSPEVYAGVIGFFVETPINIRYRLVTNDIFDTPFPQGVYNDTGEAYNYLETTVYGAEKFSINSDYNLKLTNKIYEGISTKQVDIASPKYYPTRIIYSNLDLVESSIDSYRIFRANNYRDLLRTKGKITSLFTKEELLYATTLDSLWMVQTSQQQIQTNTSSIVIGTGEFLGIEPKELINTTSGYLGALSDLCISHSPYGSLIVDSARGSISLFNGKAQEISLSGIQNWFFRNKDFALAKYNFTNISNPHNPNSVGFLTSYDVENNRFLITKRDYDLITPALFKGTTDDVDSLVESENLEVGDILLEVDTQLFKRVTSVTPVLYTTVNLTDTDYFYNKGFTLSYNLLTQTFVSYHSYIPTNYIEVRDRLYSRDVTQTTQIEQAIHLHNKGIYGRYYVADIKPFILETTLTGGNRATKVFDSFTIESYAMSNDDIYNSKVIYDLCFDSVTLYNDTQCSGIVNLTDVDIKRGERAWRFNNFKDLSINHTEPIWLTNPQLLQDDYFIDKVLNTNRLDSNKPWYEKARMRDKYINARFVLNNLDNKKFLCTFVYSNYRTSYR